MCVSMWDGPKKLTCVCVFFIFVKSFKDDMFPIVVLRLTLPFLRYIGSSYFKKMYKVFVPSHKILHALKLWLTFIIRIAQKKSFPIPKVTFTVEKDLTEQILHHSITNIRFYGICNKLKGTIWFAWHQQWKIVGRCTMLS